MSIFDWIIAVIVVISLVYICFVLTLADWLSALRRGQAVTLLPERAGHQWPMWTQILVILVGLGLCIPLFYFGWIPILVIPVGNGLGLDVAGLAIYLAGFAFTLWARRSLGKNWGISTSLQVKLREDHALVCKGPYAFVRHPMYFGWWFSMFGLTLMYPVWVVLLLLLFSVISFTGRARREEATLAGHFGAAWAEYKKHTKFLIPLIY